MKTLPADEFYFLPVEKTEPQEIWTGPIRKKEKPLWLKKEQRVQTE
jgi:hypothetical protein